MEPLDERQQQIRGKITLYGLVMMLAALLAAALINDFGLYDIAGKVGFGEFLIAISILEITYLSVALILKDAYFGVVRNPFMKRCPYIFAALSIMELMMLAFDLYRGDGITMMSGCSVLMVSSITISFWIKQKEWKQYE